MKTKTIIKDRITNQIVDISPCEIVNSGLWYSGEYEPPHECLCQESFHTCSYNPSADFQMVLDTIEEDFNKQTYMNLWKEIKNKGFIYPLGALMRSDYAGIGLIDGHHRLFIALSLKLKTIPVNIFSPHTEVIDITRWDSNLWIG